MTPTTTVMAAYQMSMAWPMLQSSTTPTAHSETTSVVAYWSSGEALDADDEDELAHIRTAWIVVHRSGRNRDDYLCCASAAVVEDRNSSGNNSSSSTTLLSTPCITIAGDLARGLIAHTWRYGADAMRRSSSSTSDNSGGGGGVSSDAVMDAMIKTLDRHGVVSRLFTHIGGARFSRRPAGATLGSVDERCGLWPRRQQE